MKKIIELHLSREEAATLDNMLTVHLSQTTSTNEEYIRILTEICSNIQAQLGV
jgi:hypothetical protein